MTSMIEITREAYPSDLKEQEWKLLEPLLPIPSGKGMSGRPQE